MELPEIPDLALAAAMAVREVADAGEMVNIKIEGLADLEYTCGSSDCPLHEALHVVSSVELLPDAPADLPVMDTDEGFVPIYVQATELELDAADPMRSLGTPENQGMVEVRIEVETNQVGIAEEEATLYYYNGEAWVDLEAAVEAGGHVEGANGYPDLEVSDAGIDAQGRVFAVVDHTSLFAVGPRSEQESPATQAPGSQSSPGSGTVLVGIALAMGLVIRAWGRR